MSTQNVQLSRLRTRWSAIGAAVAITLGAGGFGLAQAAVSTGEKPVTVTIDAERILDTRVDLGLAGGFVHATPRDLQVTGDVAVAPSGTKTVVPADAVGVIVNVTVVTPSHDGFLALRPAGATDKPETSTVNFVPGAIEPNAATVDLGPDGKIQIWVQTASLSGTADVLVDVVGYTVDHNHDDEYYSKAEVDSLQGARSFTTLGSYTFEGIGDFKLINTETVEIGRVTVTAPVDGIVTLTTNGALHAVVDGTTVTCAISSVLRFTGNDTLAWTSPDGGDRTVLSITRARPVAAGSTTTFYSFCETDSNTASVSDRSISALFTPAN